MTKRNWFLDQQFLAGNPARESPALDRAALDARLARAEPRIRGAVREELAVWIRAYTSRDRDDGWAELDAAIARGVARGLGREP